MVEKTPLDSRRIGEKSFIKWCLDYTMEPIIRCFVAIPEKHLHRRLFNELNAPSWIFGHIALNEEGLIKGFAQGIRESICPYSTNLFGGWPAITENEWKDSGIIKEELVSYWRKVRIDTHTYLDSLNEDELGAIPEKTILPDNEPNRSKPIREFFIMAIQHQNYHWGQLQVISKIATVRTGTSLDHI